MNVRFNTLMRLLNTVTIYAHNASPLPLSGGEGKRLLFNFTFQTLLYTPTYTRSEILLHL